MGIRHQKCWVWLTSWVLIGDFIKKKGTKPIVGCCFLGHMLYISVYDIWIHKQQYMVHRTPENWVYALKYVCSVVGKRWLISGMVYPMFGQTLTVLGTVCPVYSTGSSSTGVCGSVWFNAMQSTILGYGWFWVIIMGIPVYRIPLFEIMQN